MNHEFNKIDKILQLQYHQKESKTIHLFPGIDLRYLDWTAHSFSLHHKQIKHLLQINYCKEGRVGWKMAGGDSIYLGPGDFSIHTMDSCADSSMTFPTAVYKGLMISIDLQETTKNPPPFLNDTTIFSELLPEKFCKDRTAACLAGNIQAESIFTGFYGQPKNILLPYQKIKTLELLLYISKLKLSPNRQLTAYRSDQVEIIRKIHEHLIDNIEQRITIEELSKQYLINPTTLKSIFKSVYGTSLAAHIKEHRMKYAATLLRDTNRNISEVARLVGYDSQSKFTVAFKSHFQILPTEYRKLPKTPPQVSL